jgi:DNA replication protein DnaC
MEKTLSGADLLLIDELSYARFNQEESEMLFKVIAERSERASTVITTNLEFSKWTEMFASETLVAALVDRLTYHSSVLNMNGQSYRLHSSKRKMTNA